MRSTSKKSRKKKERYNWDTASKAVMTPMTEMTFKQFLETIEDTPSGEYEVCRKCRGHGCGECEHGLKDVTGQFKRPDFDEEQEEDWQDDVDDNGSSIGVCPKCEGPASYVTSGRSPRDAEAYWECSECGHQGTKQQY